MIEITISKEGEVKIKVDNKAQSVSVSRSEAESVIHGMFKSQVPKASNPPPTWPEKGVIWPPPPTPKFTPGGVDIKGDGEIIIKTDGECKASIKPVLDEFYLPNIMDMKDLDKEIEKIHHDCKRQNICGYEPKTWTRDKPGCKSGEIEGGPTY